MAIPRWTRRAFAVSVLVVALGGCGGGSGGTSTPSSPSTSRPPQAEFSKGQKGENPATEAQTSQRIARGDCTALGRIAGRLADVTLQDRSTPKPPLSKCRLSGGGVEVNLFLDAGFGAHERFRNRMVETAQFGAPDMERVPHPVPHVGFPSTYDADWVPGIQTLFAARGNRWLTVSWSVPGDGNRASLDHASTLARAAFRLTAD